MNSEDILWDLYNDKGCTDIMIQATMGEFWSKRYTYAELLEVRPNQWIRGLYRMPKAEFMQLPLHRTITNIEVILDVDNTDHDYFEFTTIKEKAKFIYMSLHNKGIQVICYFTGSKSYHLSFFDYGLRSLSKQERQAKRLRWIEYYHCDPELANDMHMIALEGSIHYKSGKEKIRVDLI